MIPFYKILHTDVDGVETNLNQYTLDFNISKGTEAKKNTITLNLTNANSKLNDINFITDDSSIKCYLDWNPITTQDPIISSTLNALSYGLDNKGKAKQKLKATDKTGLFLSKLWSQSIQQSSSIKVDAAVKQVIGHINDFDTGTSVTTNNVATTKADGSAFDIDVDIAKTWKPGYEWLNELSQPNYTGEDRPYVYWVDEDNDLHWTYPFQKPNTTLSSTIDAIVTTVPVTSTVGYPDSGTFVIDDEIIAYSSKDSTNFLGCTRGYGFSSANSHTSGVTVTGQVLEEGTDDVYKMNIDTTDEGTYNFIIYNAGETPAGYEYLDYTLDETDIGKKFKMKFYDWKQIANDLSNTERRNTGYGTTTGSYPDGGYPYTTSWAAVVADDGEYQDAFIAEIVSRAENKAKSFFIGGQQRFKATIQMRGNLDFESNELVSVVSNKYGLTNFLRIKDIKHQLNSKGWITDMELSTDVDAIST